MSSNNRKRKHRSFAYQDAPHPASSSSTVEAQFEFLAHHKWQGETPSGVDPSSKHPDPLQALYIQAYEADIIRGPQAKTAAASLEVVEYQRDEDTEGGWKVVPKIGSAVIKLGGVSTATQSENFGGVYDETPAFAEEDKNASVWVDRYDARLLLESVPSSKAPSVGSSTTTYANPPSSPSGWSDLPSDAEDMFFLTPDEAEDIRRERRRRDIENAREERLRARMEEDGEDAVDVAEEDIWGGSDEEPDDTSRELMQRTAIHVAASPNPAQLEMRILANHGGDKRFAFLRGRWSRAWNIAKAKARADKVETERRQKEVKSTSGGLGVLAGYGSGDSDDSDEGEKADRVQVAEEQKEKADDTIRDGSGGMVLTGPIQIDSEADEEARKEARRKRLKEWKEKRQTG